MRIIIKWLRKYLKINRLCKKSIQSILQNDLFRISIKKNTSLVLFSCLGFPFNSKGKRTVTWDDILIFTEKRGTNIRQFLRNSKKIAKEKGQTIEEYFDELIYTFKLLGKTIKFDRKLIELVRSIGFRVVKGKGTKVNLDVIDEFGDIRFRGTKDEIEKFISKIAQGERRLLDEFKNIISRVSKSDKAFDPLKDALKPLRDAGVKIKSSVRGLVPDFLSTPQFLYKGDVRYGKIKIKYTGIDAQDFKIAYEKAGITDKSLIGKIDSKYTWHHMDDYDPITGECTMQLVRTDIHILTFPHKGAPGLFKELFNIERK